MEGGRGAGAIPRPRPRARRARGVTRATSAGSGASRHAPVQGAVANGLAAAVPDEVKEARWHRFMARQQAVSTRRLKRKVGTRQQVIIDEIGPSVAKGRSKA